MLEYRSHGFTNLHAFSELWAGIVTILAFFRPDPRQKLTLSAVRRLGGFDRRQYRLQIPGGHWFYWLFPLRHYAILGESMGLRPNIGFCPETYLRLNPDVADAGVPPFWHWLTKGRGECRRIVDSPKSLELPHDLAGKLVLRNREAKSKYATHIHIHYAEVWPEILGDLGRNRVKTDIFVTLSYRGKATRALKTRILHDMPDAEIFILENRGRDILPFYLFLMLVRSTGTRPSVNYTQNALLTALTGIAGDVG